MEFMNVVSEKKNKLDKVMIKKTVQAVMVMFSAFIFTFSLTTPVMAGSTTTAIDSSLGTFLTLVEAVVSGLGETVTLWGISEWGISFMSSEGTMQANALKRVVGGLVMMLAPQILSLLST